MGNEVRRLAREAWLAREMYYRAERVSGAQWIRDSLRARVQDAIAQRDALEDDIVTQDEGGN